MRFVITGDIHARSSQPVCRTDDPRITIIKKFEEIYRIAYEYEAKYILCPGDLFDSHKPSWSLASTI